MQRRKGLIYPRIVEEIVDPAELQQVWNCGYLTVNRIMYGRKAPNHQQKKQLSEYLGIPVDELWITIPGFKGFGTESTLDRESDTPDNSEII